MRASEHRREAWRLAWPLILSNITVPLLGLTDTTVVGHLEAPHHLSGVAAGSTTFNVVHFAFVFLRMGTTGLVAQAFGRGDPQEVRDLLARGVVLAVGLGLLLLLTGPLLVLLASALFGTSPELDAELRIYLQIRLFGIPASFTSLVLLGWLLGRQDARGPMVMMVTTNGINIALDILFVMGLGMAAGGVAAATVLAEYAGLIVGLILVRRALHGVGGTRTSLRRLLRQGGLGRMVRVNRDIFIRSLALQASFLSFAAIGARLGDVVLAANAILLNLQTLAAFGLDGFAHAAEAMVGREVGRNDRAGLLAAVRANAELALGLALALTLGFLLAGELLIRAMTTIEPVRAEASGHLPWMIASPLVSIWAFLFDGVFIGATQTAVMRNGMILAFLVFAAAAAVLVPLYGNHGLWAAFLIFMAWRGLWLGAAYGRIDPRASDFAGGRR